MMPGSVTADASSSANETFGVMVPPARRANGLRYDGRSRQPTTTWLPVRDVRVLLARGRPALVRSREARDRTVSTAADTGPVRRRVSASMFGSRSRVVTPFGGQKCDESNGTRTLIARSTTTRNDARD